MDLDKITLFSAFKKRMAWLSQRQEVLSQNIANSDTPKYQPRDIAPFKFHDLMQQQQLQMNVERTNPMHLEGFSQQSGPFKVSTEQKPWETSPDGNAVVLEEQMAKLNDTQVKYKLTTELYKKNLAMLKIAIGK